MLPNVATSATTATGAYPRGRTLRWCPFGMIARFTHCTFTKNVGGNNALVSVGPGYSSGVLSRVYYRKNVLYAVQEQAQP